MSGASCALLLTAWLLSGWVVGRFWPSSHGAGSFVMYVLVRGVLGGVIGSVLLVAVIIPVGIVRHRLER
jgi:Cu/Ag efflux pump CusA